MPQENSLGLVSFFIDARNFTHSEFPSLAPNELLKDDLIAQLQSFWNSKKVCAKNKTKTNSKKTKKATQSSLKMSFNARTDHFGIHNLHTE